VLFYQIPQYIDAGDGFGVDVECSAKGDIPTSHACCPTLQRSPSRKSSSTASALSQAWQTVSTPMACPQSQPC